MIDSSAGPWEGDCLDRQAFGDRLLACLQAEAVFSEEAFVVALTARFGSGKSHFFRMWQADLIQKVAEAPDSFPLVVRVNAWESDFSGEPLLAIVSELSTQLADITQPGHEESDQAIKRGVAGVLAGAKKLAVDLTTGYVEEKTGVAIEGALGAFSERLQGGDLDRRARALFGNFEARKAALENLRRSLGSFISERSEVAGERNLKLILIVDELDRCHPRYAIEFLESIKHVFNVAGLAVVLGVDWDQLGCTASALFGQDLDTEEYFRKFIKRRVPLPIANEAALIELNRLLHERYLRSGSDEWAGIQAIEPNASRVLNAIFLVMDLSPRQRDAAYHLLASFLRLEIMRQGKVMKRNWYLIEFFAVVMSVKYPSQLHLFVTTSNAGGFLKFMRSLDMGGRIHKLDLDGDLIEGLLVGALRDSLNESHFFDLVEEAGYCVPDGPFGESRYQEFQSAIRRTEIGRKSPLYVVAKRVMELDLFER